MKATDGEEDLNLFTGNELIKEIFEQDVCVHKFENDSGLWKEDETIAKMLAEDKLAEIRTPLLPSDPIRLDYGLLLTLVRRLTSHY